MVKNTDAKKGFRRGERPDYYADLTQARFVDLYTLDGPPLSATIDASALEAMIEMIPTRETLAAGKA